jgi:hypothetical protein
MEVLRFLSRFAEQSAKQSAKHPPYPIVNKRFLAPFTIYLPGTFYSRSQA